MTRPVLPAPAIDNPQRRRTLITLAAWASLGTGLSGCGGGGSGDAAPTAQTSGLPFNAAATARSLLSFLAGNVTGVTLSLPTAIAVANDGTAYLVDKSRHVLMSISPDGIVQILAGQDGFPGAYDGSNTGAAFQYPQGVAVSSKGVVYVADTDNHTIRQVTSGDVVSTLAGSAGNWGNRDGVGNEASFRYPCGLAVDANGNIYVADSQNHTIRRITADGQVSTIAGLSGVPGSADGGLQTSLFNTPYAVAVDGQGNVYVADSGNHTIRVIDGKGQTRTLAGLAGNPGSTDGKGTEARFYGPRGIQVDTSGTVYVTDRDNQTVRQITAGGVVSTWAGQPGQEGLTDGAGKDASFNLPMGLGSDAKGTLFVTELANRSVRKISTAGVVSTVISEATGMDGVGSAAHFSGPQQVAIGKDGVVYVADSYHHAIRKVQPDGNTTTLAGLGYYGNSVDGTGAQAGFSYPSGVVVDDNGTVFVADTYSHTIRKITPAGVVTTLAGTFNQSGGADGTGKDARFRFPLNLALDAQGNLYVADSSNSTIRKVTPAGVVTTLAGKAGEFNFQDGQGAEARFSNPQGVAVDSQGNVYVADYSNALVRKITPGGLVSTLAGKRNDHSYVDGKLADARFGYPWRIAVDGADQLYVADAGSRTIRKISTGGDVSTFAGSPSTPGFQSGVLPGSFDNCSGLAIRANRLVLSTRDGLAQIGLLT